MWALAAEDARIVRSWCVAVLRPYMTVANGQDAKVGRSKPRPYKEAGELCKD